jgi:hypothetical protein
VKFLATLAVVLAACSSDAVSPASRDIVATSPGVDLFFVSGQSNARGPFGYSDPASLRADIGTFSAFPTFAIEYERLTGVPVAVYNARVGGASQTWQSDVGRNNGSWDHKGTLWQQGVTSLDSLMAAHPDHTLRGVIWVQCEADAGAIERGTVTRGQYERALSGMIARYRAKYGAIPFYIVRCGAHARRDSDGYRQARLAQTRIADNDPLTHIAYAGTVNFPAKGLMYDHVHWSQAGQEIVGRAVARYIAASPSYP